MANTQDVTEYVGYSYDLVYRLRSLAAENRVESNRIANARLWFTVGGA